MRTRSRWRVVWLLLFGLAAAGCTLFGDDPKRTFSLPNDTGGPRLVRRCNLIDDCRFPKEGEIVQPGESFEFRVYPDEERAYVVANGEGRTFGCVSVHVADGTGGYPESLSDLHQCPRDTPKVQNG
jgi:hypothetical protein